MSPLPDQKIDALDTAEARAQQLARRSKAQNTRRTYESAWDQYAAYCTASGLEALSNDPTPVRLYLAQASAHLAPSSLKVHLSAIAAKHREAGFSLDTRHPKIAEVMAGAVRLKGLAPKRQAAPMLPDTLKELRSKAPESLIGIRDRALLLLGFGAATRRSELVALDVKDVKFEKNGLRVHIRRSKTDQAGVGQMVAIHSSTDLEIDVPSALRAWLDVRGRAPGPLFVAIGPAGRVPSKISESDRLSDKAVARAVQVAISRLGDDKLDPRSFSGHSLRAGMVTAALSAGADLRHTMRHSRHKTVETALSYDRERETWKNNATAPVFQKGPKTED